MAFHSLLTLSQLHDGYKHAFKVEGLSLLVVQDEGKVYIFDNRCPHMDVPLNTGVITSDSTIRCRSHGIEFKFKDGRAVGGLADTLGCLKFYTPVYEGTSLGVEL